MHQNLAMPVYLLTDATRTNYHKFRGFKQYPFIISQFCRSPVVSLLLVSQGQNQGAAWDAFPSECSGGESFSGSCRQFAELRVCRMRSLFPFWLPSGRGFASTGLLQVTSKPSPVVLPPLPPLPLPHSMTALLSPLPLLSTQVIGLGPSRNPG